MVNAIQFGGSPKQILFTPTPKKVAFACGGAPQTCLVYCIDDNAPAEIELAISGFASGSCANCNALNGT